MTRRYWFYVFQVPLISETNHTLRRVPGGDSASHGGGASPRLMREIDDLLQGHISNCDAFVDAGSGIGTALAYHAQKYIFMRIVGIECYRERIERARFLFGKAGMKDRVQFVEGSFVNERVWSDHVLLEANERVCVWLNAENFFENGLLLQFERLAERLIVAQGSLIVSTERLFHGRTRNSTRDGCPFELLRRMRITLQEGDLSWKAPRKILDVFVYRRMADGMGVEA